MISDDLLKILSCPACKTKVELVKDKWLVCQDEQCRFKYPILDDIPIMLAQEGMKWRFIAIEELPVPPPRPGRTVSERRPTTR